jgi:hypothetical protein
MTTLVSPIVLLCVLFAGLSLIGGKLWLYRMSSSVIAFVMVWHLIFGIDSIARSSGLESSQSPPAFSERQYGVQIFKERLLPLRTDLLVLTSTLLALVWIRPRNTPQNRNFKTEPIVTRP